VVFSELESYPDMEMCIRTGKQLSCITQNDWLVSCSYFAVSLVQ
jgi:hypothetical protein